MLTLNDIHSFSASISRLGRGMKANSEDTRQPDETLVLYEFEGCPFCRKVREVFTKLDLNYECRPCGKGSNNREKLIEEGGNEQVPFLIDPNTGESMYESEDIITYLAETYASGRSSVSELISPVNTFGAWATSVIRPKGIYVKKGLTDRTQPDEMLVLYNFEASPFCRKVREKLCELNLDYLVKNVGKGSERRPELIERGGMMQVPYLIDPNTDTEMYESYDIVDYLESEYGR